MFFFKKKRKRTTDSREVLALVQLCTAPQLWARVVSTQGSVWLGAVTWDRGCEIAPLSVRTAQESAINKQVIICSWSALDVKKKTGLSVWNSSPLNGDWCSDATCE